MHELQYELEQGDPGAARRLARWVAMGSLLVFSLMATDYVQGLIRMFLAFGEEFPTGTAMMLEYGVQSLVLPLCMAIAIVWLATGRVLIVVLSIAPAIFALVVTSASLRYGLWSSWDGAFVTMGWALGSALLSWLFLTPTFRRAVNAPRHRAASAGPA